MPVIIVFKALWRMLETRRRITFLLLVGLLFAAGVLEMGGMVVLFGFVRGLSMDEQSGERGGQLGRMLESMAGGTLSQLEYVIGGGAVVVGFMVAKNAQGTLSRFAMNRFMMKLNQRVSTRLYKAYLLAPLEVLRRRNVQAATKKIHATFLLYNKCFAGAAQVIADSSIILTVVALLLYVDVLMTFFAVFLFGVVAGGVHFLTRRRLEGLGVEAKDADSKVRQYLREGLDGVVDVRLKGSRDFFLKQYGVATSKSALMVRRQFALSRLPRSANEIALACMIVGATLVVTLKGLSVEEALPQLSVFGFAGLRLVGVMGRLNAAVQDLRRLKEAFGKSQVELQRVVPEMVGLPEKARTDYLKDERPFPKGVDGKLHSEIALTRVSFKFHKAKRHIVRAVSLKVKRGQHVAICGPSGSGKSTLALLLMGLLKPLKGKVTCDDWSVHEHIQSWHRNIGYVSQSFFLVNRSVRENVGFGLVPEEIDDEKIWKALKLASADEFVRQMPKGLDTAVGPDGANLSGGQRQRLVIARALYDDPEVLVFDEATASLDNVTEREIAEAIRGVSGKKTVVSVAHRMSTIRDCDAIYFLVDGQIVAQGTYDELAAECEPFQAMLAAGEAEANASASQAGT